MIFVVRIGCSSYHRLYLRFYIFVYFDYHKCGQASCTVAGVKVPTSCNFEADLSNDGSFLGCVYCRHDPLLVELCHNLLDRFHSYFTVSFHLIFLVFQNFSYSAPSSSQSTTSRKSATTKSSNSYEHSTLQEGSVCYIVGSNHFTYVLPSTWYSGGFYPKRIVFIDLSG